MTTHAEREARKTLTEYFVKRRLSSQEIADKLGVKRWTVIRYRQELVWAGRIRPHSQPRKDAA